MPYSVKKVFSVQGSKKSDGLRQAQREAIVDLLHYCMFADNFVALAEDRFVNELADTLNWDPNISFESYEGGSIGNARRAKESAAYREQFLQGIVSRLETKEAKALALKLTKQLYASDQSGTSTPEAEQLIVLSKLLA